MISSIYLILVCFQMNDLSSFPDSSSSSVGQEEYRPDGIINIDHFRLKGIF